MVNIRWDIYNMLTIWLMVLIMFAAFGLGKSLIAGGQSSVQA
jgi:hypothetical protein